MVKKQPAQKASPKRLVKLWLPAGVIRSVDELVTVSDGAYRDRDEFFTEAALDRLRDEAERRGSSAPQPRVVPLAGLPDLGAWRGSQIPTAKRVAARAHGGLHNRDIPTLWAFDQLLAAVAERGSGFPYRDLVQMITPAAQKLGARLAERDRYREAGSQRSGIGFPAPEDAASAERFRVHMLGEVLTAGAAPQFRGPLFALGLAAASDGLVLPTEDGRALLEGLLDDGFGLIPPQPEAAWLRFRSHLAHVLPEDLGDLRAVLAATVPKPSRTELVNTMTPRWKDATAIALTGLVSRGREWGLISPRLDAGRYVLTPAGTTELKRSAVEAAA